MDDSIGSDKIKKKSDGVADAINRQLTTLIIKCAKADGIRDYFYIGVLGYGKRVGPAFSGSLSDRQLVPISEVAKNPARLEERTKNVDDGYGGIINQQVKVPIWFDPVADNGTPMTEAFAEAEKILKQWLYKFPNCFPPIVINITDGEATDGDPSIPAKLLKKLSSSDGNVLLFTIHISCKNIPPIEFPDSELGLPDEFSRFLFNMTSILPNHLKDCARQKGYKISKNSRGFVFNGDLNSILDFLDIGTRPSNLR